MRGLPSPLVWSFLSALIVFAFIFLFFYPFVLTTTHYADFMILFLLRVLFVMGVAALLYLQVRRHAPSLETLTLALYILANNLGISYAYGQRRADLIALEEKRGFPALALLHVYSLVNVVVVGIIIGVKCKCCRYTRMGDEEKEEMYDKVDKLL